MKKVKDYMSWRWIQLIAMALLIWSCQKEELLSDPQITQAPIPPLSIQKVPYDQLPSSIKDLVDNWGVTLQNKKISNKIGEAFGEVLQDQSGVLTTNGVTSYTLGMEKLFNDNQFEIANLVITENEEGSLHAQILRYIPSYEWIKNKNEKGLNWELYTGEIAIYDIDGTIKAKGQFKNGKSIGYTSNKGMQGKSDEQDCVVSEVSVGGLEQNGEFYPTDIIIDYECSGGGGTSGDSDSGFPNGGGMFPHDGGETHGGGSSGGGGSSDDGQIPTLIDDRLVYDKIVSNLTGKAACVFKKIIKNTILAKTLEKFNGEKTPFHLMIEQKSDLRNVKGHLINGMTNYGDSYYITITLNKEQSENRPSLAVVRTFLHEAIHAEIFRKIKSTTSDVSKIYVDKEHWPALFDYYNQYPKNPHHNYMADYYRAAIEKGMRAYASVIGETHSDQFYKDMAWAGLLNTETWNNLYTDPTYANIEKKRIQTVISNYEKSSKNECH